MSDAAAAPATASAQPAAPPPDAKPAPKTEHMGEPGTTQNRVKSLADQLRQRREGRIIKAPGGDEKPAAKADDKPQPKAKAEPAGGGDKAPEKREAKDSDKSKAEPAKDGPQRDEHGRFTSADGGKDADKGKPKDAPAKDDEPPPAAAKGASEAKDKAEPPKAETKPEQPPEKRQEPAQKGDSARLARTLVELRDTKAENLELSKKAKLWDQHEEQSKAVKGSDTFDDEHFEETYGRSFEQMVKDLAASKVKFKAKTPLSPEMRALKADLDALKAERAAEKERVEREQARKAGEAGRAKEIELVKAWLPEVEDKYPYLTSFDDAADQVLDAFYAAWPRDSKGRFIPGRKPDVEEIAEQIEAYGARRFSAAGGNKRAMVALLKDPKAKALAIEILGLQQPAATETTSPQRHDKGNQSAPAEGPRTLSNTVTQDVPALVKKTKTEEEEREALHTRWRAAMAAQGR